MPDDSKELQFKITTSADLSGAEKTAAALADANNEIKKLSGSQDENAESAARTEINQRSLHMTLSRLNLLVPGLGDELIIMLRGMEATGEGALTAAEAMDVFYTSVLPLLAAFASLEIIVGFWDRYKKASKEAADQAAKDAKDITDAAEKATKAFKEFQDVLAGTDKGPAAQYQNQLENRTKIVEARDQQENELAKSQETAALAAATSPEQKDAIKQQFEADQKTRDQQHEADKLEQQAAVLATAQADLDKRASQIQNLNQAEQLAQRSGNPKSAEKIADDLAEATKQFKELGDFVNELKQNVATGSTVLGIHQDTQAQQTDDARSTQFMTGVQAILGEYGTKLDAGQKEAEATVTQAIIGYGGNALAFLDLVKRLHLRQDQQDQAIQAEIAVLRAELSRTTNAANNHF